MELRWVFDGCSMVLRRISGVFRLSSLGAAILEGDGDVLKSGAAGYSVLAAPEDGRTPAQSPSSVVPARLPATGAASSAADREPSRFAAAMMAPELCGSSSILA